MLLNYIKIALRNFTRHKVYAAIDIMGLAVGMACAVLLLLFVQDELSYGRNNSKYDRIYMVQTHRVYEGVERFHQVSPSFTFGQALKNQFPVIEECVRTYPTGSIYFVGPNGQFVSEENVWFADPEIFDVFDHQFVYGSPEDALDGLGTIVLSESFAKRYFGKKNPVGETLPIQNGGGYIVKGVFEDLPQNSFQRYDALISTSEMIKGTGSQEISDNFFVAVSYPVYAYLLLSEHADISDVADNYGVHKEKILAESDLAYINRPEIDTKVEPIFKTLADNYLNSRPWPNFPISILQRVYIMAAIALLILAIACINYMNHATARSSGRAREVGIRKVLGAGRSSLIRQFLCEAVITTLAAMLIALVLIELFLPDFNSLVGKELRFGAGMDLFSGLVLTTLLVGIAAGSYPAFLLSSFLPARVLRAGAKSGADGGRLRKVLVVIQYALSIVIITCTMTLIGQMSYIRHKDLGYNPSGVFIIDPSSSGENISIQTLKNELLKNSSSILAVTNSSMTAGGEGSHRMLEGVRGMGQNGGWKETDANLLSVDTDFLDLMEMEVLDGRSFNKDLKSDETKVLVNEAFVRDMGWTDSAVGKRIEFGRQLMVLGVLKNFYFSSLRQEIEPMLIMLEEDAGMYHFPASELISIRIQPGQTEKAMRFIEEKWLEMYPEIPVEIRSAEDIIDSQYQAEETAIRIFICAAFLCIFVSFLGLFGLSYFVAETRTKEIGIRKTFGASAWRIATRLSFGFLQLAAFSIIIAWPVAYYAMDRWLDNFAYRLEISPWQFILSAGTALLIALAAVAFHTLKAAMTDPVKALRYE
jgi:putative ABC transport system permease protein